MSEARGTYPIVVLAAIAAASIFPAPAASAFSHAFCMRWARAQLDPYDLNVMRSSVSAAARLAVVQRLRSLVAQCEAVAPRHAPRS